MSVNTITVELYDGKERLGHVYVLRHVLRNLQFWLPHGRLT
jgi:hypothetical protein